MLNKLSSRRSTYPNHTLVVKHATLGHLWQASNLSSFKMVLVVQNTKNAHVTTNIDLMGPSTTLHPTASDIALDENTAEAEAATLSEGQSDIDDEQIDKEHWYHTDISQLVQNDIAALGMPIQAEIQSMIIHEIIDYQAIHLFPVLPEKVDAGFEEAFMALLLGNYEAIGLELNAVFFRAGVDTIRGKQDDSTIHQATC